VNSTPVQGFSPLAHQRSAQAWVVTKPGSINYFYEGALTAGMRVTRTAGRFFSINDVPPAKAVTSEHRQEFFPGGRKQSFGGRVPIGADDDGCFFDFSCIRRFDNIHDVETPQGCETLLPDHTGTVRLDSFCHHGGQLLKLLGDLEALPGKTTQNDIGGQATSQQRGGTATEPGSL